MNILTDAIFLTGGTGFLGTQILQEILNSTDNYVFVLIKAGSEDLALKRLSNLYWDIPELREEVGKRIIPVLGEITQKGLGITREVYSVLIKIVGYIIHSEDLASNTESKEELWKVNVTGTRNVLEFAREVSMNHKISRFSHVSTAYVAGKRKGEVFEDELINFGFSSLYEESKFEGEKIIRKYQNELDISVFRPGRIVGDSLTGRVKSFDPVYNSMKMYLNNKLLFMPINKTLKINIIPIDYVARAILRGTFDKRGIGKTFHVTANGDQLPTIDNIISFIKRWAQKELNISLPKPIFFNMPFMSKIAMRFNVKTNLPFTAAFKHMSNRLSLAPYFNEIHTFNNQNTRMLMGENSPRWIDYLEALLKYAVYLGFEEKSYRTIQEQILFRLKSRNNGLSFHNISEKGIGRVVDKDLIIDIRKVATALLSMGVKPGDKVAIVGVNSCRYMTIDVATGLLGCVLVPLHFKAAAEETVELVKHSQSKILFLGEKKIIENMPENLDNIKIVSFLMEENKERLLMDYKTEGIMSWEDLLALGSLQKDFDDNQDYGKLETIRYTPGTTETAKGVMFSHYNIKWMAEALNSMLPWKLRNSKIRQLSYLPMNGVFEGILSCYSAFYSKCKVSLYFLQDAKLLTEALPKVRPTIFFSTPEFYEKLWENFSSSNFGMKYISLKEGKFKRQLAKVLKYMFLRKAGLNCCRHMIVNSVPINSQLLEAFRGLGIEIHNAYGLTEAPLIALNRFGKNKIGSTGCILPETQLKIATDGEILVKGPQVTMGTFEGNNPGLFKDGYLKTGDLGDLKDAYLFVYGNKKELIINSYEKDEIVLYSNSETIVK